MENKYINPLIKIVFLGIILFMFSCSETVRNGYFRTTSLNDSVWKFSEWISAANSPVVESVVVDGTRAADGASWFVSTINNEKRVSKVLWMTTGLGVYDIFINGKLIGDEILKPGFTHFEKRKLSFTYDITDAFNRGVGEENVLSAQVTPGWWADKIITPSGNSGMIGKKCAFRGVLEITFDDGSTKYLGTNTENWVAGIAGPVKHAAIFDGEEYDARILPGFKTLEKLIKPEVNNEFKGIIAPSNGAEIFLRHDLSLSPIKAYKWSGITDNDTDCYGKVKIIKEFSLNEPMIIDSGENLVIDFGQNCAAVPYFIFEAKEGTLLECYTAELLNDGNGAKDRGMDGPEGSVHRLNLRVPQSGMMIKYVFSDSSKEVSYYPRSTFFGYRFLSIKSSDKVIIKDIRSIPVTSITQNMECGTISTGNELVNRLISNTVWGQRSNYLSVPTDCPQRNERLGWTADTQVFAETGTFFANTSTFFHKWMADLIDTQSSTGGFPGVAPVGQYGGEMMRVGWADAGIIVPWVMWKQFGDKNIIEQCWNAMETYISHVNDTKYDHITLSSENKNYQWADWLSYEPLESCGGGAFTKDSNGKNIPRPESIEYWSFLGASYWVIDATMMRDMAKAIGKDSSKYETMISEAKDYIRARFFTSEGKFKTDILNTMQTPALFTLKNQILDGKPKDDMIKRLRKNFSDHDNCLQTGFLGTSILMSTLTDNGMSDIAWNLLFQRKNPSWLYSVDNGATTIWERWNSYMLDKGMGPKGMNSFNHYAYGVVCEWIWETAAGISSDISNPGFKHIIMKPVPDKRLGHLTAVYNSVSGSIKSAWRYEGDNWIWEFSIPEGSKASVTLPGENTVTEYGPGEYKIIK